MIRNKRVWSGTKSNTVNVHAFISGANRPAACNGRIKAGSETLLNMNEREATSLPTHYCPKCETALTSMVNRRDGSMQPSTGEGDYLPPSVQTESARLIRRAINLKW